jgi:hypothetical protein
VAITDNILIDLFLDEPGLEYKEELVFDDGTVYRGQVRDKIRHGYGTSFFHLHLQPIYILNIFSNCEK